MRGLMRRGAGAQLAVCRRCVFFLVGFALQLAPGDREGAADDLLIYNPPGDGHFKRSER